MLFEKNDYRGYLIYFCLTASAIISLIFYLVPFCQQIPVFIKEHHWLIYLLISSGLFNLILIIIACLQEDSIKSAIEIFYLLTAGLITVNGFAIAFLSYWGLPVAILVIVYIIYQGSKPEPKSDVEYDFATGTWIEKE